MLKKVLIVFVLLAIIGMIAFRLTIGPKLPILTGYAAKKMCSCTFIGGHPQEKIQNEDLAFSPVNLSSSKIDHQAKTVTAKAFGLGGKTAVFRNGLGCILLDGKDDYKNDLQLNRPTKNTKAAINQVQQVTGVDYENLNKICDLAFDPNGDIVDKKTLGLAVYYKDSLVYEAYANGYNENTPMLGWSMTKSITSTLIGIMKKNGVISEQEDHLFPYWDDERSSIKLHDLLQMQSGLQFDENYGEVSDVTKMLFMTDDVVEVASKQPLAHPIGSHWNYSSGTTNVISGIIKNRFDNINEYHRFPYDSLFFRIGMNNTTMETDESGNFIGSSYCYAPLKEWGNFGLLYLNEGNWYGDQVIDTSWVDYVQQSAENSNGYYGGHFWHNKGQKAFKDIPADMYHASGFEGQNVFIIPSRDVVIVRMGLNENFAFNSLVKYILEAIENPS